jgi:hypothetical protein
LEIILKEDEGMSFYGLMVKFTGGAVMGIYSMLMLISAVFLVFTPEVSDWTAVCYVVLPLLFFVSVLCSTIVGGLLPGFQKLAMIVPLFALFYFTYAFPELLTPLYASFRIWSGISIYGLLGSQAMMIITLIVFESYLIFSFGGCLIDHGKLSFPLFRFLCMNLYFMVFIPIAFLFKDVIQNLGTPDHYPRYLVFIPIIVLYALLGTWKKYFPFHEISCQIYSYPIFIIASYFIVFFFMSKWGYQGPDSIFTWYAGLLEQHPWTIVFGIIAGFVVFLLVTGRLVISGGSSSGSSPSGSSSGGESGSQRWAREQRAYEHHKNTSGWW